MMNQYNKNTGGGRGGYSNNNSGGIESLKEEFINPYNYAENLDINTRNQIRYQWEHEGLLSGRIKLRLKLESPSAIGDKSTKKPINGGNSTELFNHLNFYRYNGELAIPATTLKGMSRSVFELITGSCMFHYNKDDYEGFRTTESASSEINAGVIQTIPTRDQAGEVRVCDKYLILPEILKNCGCEDLYMKKLSCFKVFVKLDKSNKRVIEISKSEKPGFEEAYLNISGKMNTPKINFCSDHPAHMSKIPASIKGKVDGGARIKVSYTRLKQSSQNRPTDANFISNISESPSHVYMGELFKDSKGFTLQPSKKEVVAVMTKETAVLESSEANKYLHVFRHGQRFKEDKLELKKGDVIFFTKANGKVTNIIRASLGRVAFNKSVSQIFTDFEKPCYLYNIEKNLNNDDVMLCPACQVFGFTEDMKQTRGAGKGAALAGRVFFSHGIIEDKTIKTKTTPIKILNSPHPSCTFFYIKNKNGSISVKKQTKNGPIDAMLDYDGDARIRGRKFYVRQANADFIEQNKQLNSKQHNVVEYIEKGSFTFDIDFENLTDFELGALLYSLTLDEGMLHSVGHAKPLGMGDCKITVEELLIDTPERVMTLDVSKWTIKEDPAVKIKAFKDELSKKMNGKPFKDIDAIHSLAAIRDAKGHPLVKYPSKKDNRGEEHGFKWFMEHANYDCSRKNFIPQPLPLAKELASKKLKK